MAFEKKHLAMCYDFHSKAELIYSEFFQPAFARTLYILNSFCAIFYSDTKETQLLFT
jgi:hypothetical protein